MRKALLKEIACFTPGFAFSSNNFSSEHGLPLIRIRDVKRGYSEIKYNGDYDPTFIIEDGDYLIGMDGEFNIGEWRGGKALLNQRVCKLHVNRQVASPKYVFYALGPLLKRIESTTPFVTVKHLSAGKLESSQIPLPPLPEQKRLAAILEKADGMRQKFTGNSGLLRSLRQALFLKMFSPLHRHAHKDLKCVAAIRSGIPKGKRYASTELIEVPYLRVANVQSGHLDMTEIKTLSVLPEEVQKYALIKNDILMTEGGDIDKLGRGTVWPGEIEPCIHQNHIFCVRLDQDQVIPDYFDALLQTAYTRQYFMRAAKKTSNLASINKAQLSVFQVPLPPLPLQREFAARVQAVRRLEEKQKQAAQDADDLFQSLLQRAFSGSL